MIVFDQSKYATEENLTSYHFHRKTFTSVDATALFSIFVWAFLCSIKLSPEHISRDLEIFVSVSTII